MVQNTMESLQEAMAYMEDQIPGDGPLLLSVTGWSRTAGATLAEVKQCLRFTIFNAYTVNGGRVRRQKQGMPMGLPEAPQLTALALYPIEKKYALTHQTKGLITRYIDDFACSGMEPPPQENYGMEYKLTSDDPADTVYLGVRTVIRDGRVHTTLFDREEDYPFHIVRYLEGDTTAPRPQLGGVLMGRYSACQDA